MQLLKKFETPHPHCEKTKAAIIKFWKLEKMVRNLQKNYSDISELSLEAAKAQFKYAVLGKKD